MKLTLKPMRQRHATSRRELRWSPTSTSLGKNLNRELVADAIQSATAFKLGLAMGWAAIHGGYVSSPIPSTDVPSSIECWEAD